MRTSEGRMLERPQRRGMARRAVPSAARRSEQGSSVVELAIFLAFLGPPLIFGTASIATLAYSSIEVENAAHAGVMYAMQSATYASDTAGIAAAARQEAADIGANLAVTPTTFYVCSDALAGTHYSTLSAATTACTGTGNHGLELVQVSVSATVTPPFHVPAVLASYTAATSSVMEVQQ